MKTINFSDEELESMLMMYYDELAEAKQYAEQIQAIIKKLTSKPAKEPQKRGRKPQQVLVPNTTPEAEKMATKVAKPKVVKVVKPKAAKVAKPKTVKKKREPKPKEIRYEGIEPLSNILYPTKADKLKYANAIALMEKKKVAPAKSTATPKE